MRVTYLGFTALLIETDDASILCDPWLTDGAYHGSWAHYPPVEFDPVAFDHADYVYLSHGHPDGFDPATLSHLDDDVPVLVHDAVRERLRDAVADLGFEVFALPDDRRTRLIGDTHVNVLAADGRDSAAGAGDPTVRGDAADRTDDDGVLPTRSTRTGSIAVVDDGQFTLVDTGDAPYPAVESACRAVKAAYGEIDLLAHRYSATTFFPQAITDYDHGEKLRERNRVIREERERAVKLVDIFEPSYHLPFAGEYVLAGRLAHLNEYTATPSRARALDFFQTHVDDDHECVFLDSGEHVDLASGERSAPFRPPDPVEKRRYVREELVDRTFDYEDDPSPTIGELRAYVPRAFENLEATRDRVGYATAATVLISLPDDVSLELSFDGTEPTYVTDPDLDHYDRYVGIDVDPRLLRRLLAGSHDTNWDAARIGSHLGIAGDPDVLDRGLFDCLGSFQARGRDVEAGTEPDAPPVGDRPSAE